MFLLAFLLVSSVLIRADQRIVDDYIVHIESYVLTRIETTDKSSGYLDLSNLELMEIDVNCFEGLTGLKNLTLADNYLFRKLPYMVFRFLSDLEYLSLARSNVKELQYVFWGLKSLRTLDLRNNKITELKNGSFYGLSNTTEILMSGNRVVAIEPEHFLKPFKLLSFCKINGIVKTLQVFTVLRDEINVSKNCSRRYRPLINNTVDLSVEGIEGFANGWFRISRQQVHTLYLGRNNIKNLSKELINDLPRGLSEVNLSWNRISSVDADTIENWNLRKLNLRGNPIVRIDPYAFENTRITDLIIPIQFIETLPRSVRLLTLDGMMGNLQYQCTNTRTDYW